VRKPQDIIVKPVMTEKSTTLTQTQNVITFQVAKDANKVEIKNAVETLFQVKVDAVRVMHKEGKIRKVGRSIGRTSPKKKAYVKLAPGQKLPPIFEGV
jgi:large subunit ribosomal protein L23